MKQKIILYFSLLCILAVIPVFGSHHLSGASDGVSSGAGADHPGDAAQACRGSAPDTAGLPPPPLMDGIGQASFEISCSPAARRYFDQGINLIHCFWDFEALRAFQEVVRLDPSCAMGWWGIHRALYYNRRERGAERDAALEEAVRLMDKASERERYFIRAASELVVQGKDKPAEGRAAFLREMEALVDRYPGDLQAKLFLADFLRQGYEPSNGRPKEGQLYGQAILGNLLVSHPENAAVHHYWIHAVENSSRPEEGLASAAVMAQLAPRCGHIVHMPGHIHYRVGDYDKARASFLESREVDLAYMREQGISPVNTWNYIHNLDYLVGSCAEDGRYQEGLRWADELGRLAVDPDRSMSHGQGFILYGGQTARARLQMRYGLWDEAARSLEAVAAQAPPAEGSLARDYQAGTLAYARGMAATARGDAAAVRTQARELDALVKRLSDATPTVGSDWYFNTAIKILRVNLLELWGGFASVEGRYDQAIQDLQKAVEWERDLGYWEPPHYTRPVVETLAGVYERAGRWQEAREAWRHSLKLRPRNGHALHGIARAWAAEGNLEEASAAWETFRQAWRNADPDLMPGAEPPAIHRGQAAAGPSRAAPPGSP